ncbi:hypothetical protein SK128_005992, partial [Halocaridina rubra]
MESLMKIVLSYPEEVVYTAAALEHEAYSDLTEGGLALLQENARIFKHFASLAKQQ